MMITQQQILLFLVYSGCCQNIFSFTTSDIKRGLTQQQRHSRNGVDVKPAIATSSSTITRTGVTSLFAKKAGLKTNKKSGTEGSKKKESAGGGVAVLERDEDVLPEDDKPADITGNKFFGGSQEKDELYDADAEAKVTEITNTLDGQYYNRFKDPNAFSNNKFVQSMACKLQEKINSVLYNDGDDRNLGAMITSSSNTATGKIIDDSSSVVDCSFSKNLDWTSCFPQVKKASSSTSPIVELENALDFYRRIDVVITSGKQVSENKISFGWQISVIWPIFWEPRVSLTGSSTLTLKTERTSQSNNDVVVTVTKQEDEFDHGSGASATDILSLIGKQLTPRFWDVYHLGMTPSAELMTRTSIPAGNLFANYDVFEIPSRLVLSAEQVDLSEERENFNAQMIPNHAFTCMIKTMGPLRRQYVPASPVEIGIKTAGSENGIPNSLELKWTIPLAVTFQTNSKLPIPMPDVEGEELINPDSQYEYHSRRRVATVPYGGYPQDKEISKIRKQLYDQIIKDGKYKPKLDSSGRPQFSFLQNTVKPCYTDGGLGMCVYEWQPKLVNPNEVVIELEM